MPLFVEKAVDGYGKKNRIYPYAVVQGKIDTDCIRIEAPLEFAKKHPLVERFHFIQVSDRAGNPRMFSQDKPIESNSQLNFIIGLHAIEK